MILIPHLVIGAVIAVKIPYWPLAIVLAFLSHYFLDFFPHIEYSIDNIRQRRWRKIKPDIFKLTLDLIIGLILIFSIQQLTNINPLLILATAFFAILPDILIILLLIFPKNVILQKNFYIHQKVHLLNNNPPSSFAKLRTTEGQRKISNGWRVLTQIAFVILGFAFIL
ncbi:hypothetical protein KJ786_00645 [Patescibacteria group bacterium]|nr:hypothetical protein [Patescibacteria group bacterium]